MTKLLLATVAAPRVTWKKIMTLEKLKGRFSNETAPDVVAWTLARTAIEHENVLAIYRLTLFFTAQGILFSGYFLILNELMKVSQAKDASNTVMYVELCILIAIVALGIFMCLFISAGLKQAQLALDNITVHFLELQSEHGWSEAFPLHLSPVKSRKDITANGKIHGFWHQKNVPRYTLLLWAFVGMAIPGWFNEFGSASESVKTWSYVVFFLVFTAIAGFGWYSIRHDVRKLAIATRKPPAYDAAQGT